MAFMEAPGGDGEFTVYVKYNAKAGRWYTKDDQPNATEFEVVNMTAVFDIPNLKTGWFLFQAGSAPDKAINPSSRPGAPSPLTPTSVGSRSTSSRPRTCWACASLPPPPAR